MQFLHPYRITFVLQADELGKRYTEVFWGYSERNVCERAHAGAGPNRIIVLSTKPAYDVLPHSEWA